jgi:hypothetical protein
VRERLSEELQGKRFEGLKNNVDLGKEGFGADECAPGTEYGVGCFEGTNVDWEDVGKGEDTRLVTNLTTRTQEVSTCGVDLLAFLCFA